MPKKVEQRIRKVMRKSNVDKGSAIAILKAGKQIKQKGKHLVMRKQRGK